MRLSEPEKALVLAILRRDEEIRDLFERVRRNVVEEELRMLRRAPPSQVLRQVGADQVAAILRTVRKLGDAFRPVDRRIDDEHRLVGGNAAELFAMLRLHIGRREDKEGSGIGQSADVFLKPGEE